jgi:HD-like signal output (HDOD) protein
MSKKRILFVDDDVNLLSGLKRMLRSMRKEFDMQFAENGQEALEKMEKDKYDVVVSDMRMPGMDGAELLTKIQTLHPYSIRIMLTGQADENSILRTVGVVHQFLAKPCEPDLLKAVLLRASALHKLITQDSLKKIISGIDTLPSIPEVYAKLRKAMSDPEIPITRVAEIIEEDIAMSAKVLQLVNSAFFGLFQTIISPAHAVKLLGVDTIKSLVLGVGAFTEIKTSSKIFPAQQLWTHSMAVASCSKKIALSESSDKTLIDNCFISGMLHDIGQLVLLAKLQPKYEEAVLLAKKNNIYLRTAEKEIFGSLHCDIGAYLMGLWGMPGPVVEAIGFHHRLDNYPSNEFSPAIAVHAANTFYYENKPNTVIGRKHDLDIHQLSKLGFTEHIDKWRKLCTDFFEQEDETI